jgi:predicted amidohydrolase
MCQIFALDGDREGNFVRIEAALQEAREQGAQIACFPETTLLGWVNPEAHKRAHPIPGPDSERLAQLARQYGVFISAGLAERSEGRLYDAAVLIDPQGRILLKHRKINILTELMDPPYTPGQEVQAVRTPLGTIGLLICADTFEESLCQRLRELKPDLVLVPYGWAANEAAWPQHGESLQRVIQQAARRMNAVVVGTDAVGAISHGPWKGKTYGGQSTAADAQGTILAVLKDRQREVRVVSLKRP